MRRPILFLLGMGLVFAAALCSAGTAAGAPAPKPSGAALQIPGLTTGSNSQALTIMVVLTILTVIPALLLSMSPFVRLLVVFHFLRQALGTQATPTNQTLIGLSLFLTFFIMQPVGARVYDTAVVPFEKGSVSALGAVELGATPMRQFMLKYAREKILRYSWNSRRNLARVGQRTSR